MMIIIIMIMIIIIIIIIIIEPYTGSVFTLVIDSIDVGP